MKNWKTTAQSLLTVGLTLTTAALATNMLPAKWATLLIAVQGVMKAAIGIVQVDAPKPAAPETK